MSRQVLEEAAARSRRDAEVLDGEACALDGMIVMLGEMLKGERHLAIAAIARGMEGEIEGARNTISKLSKQVNALAQLAREQATELQLRAECFEASGDICDGEE